jgi:hypothetical protein
MGVIAGLDPAIHRFNDRRLFLMECRAKPGNDGVNPAGAAPPVRA